MDTPPVARFEAFTPEHFGLLAGFAVVCAVLVVIGRAHRGTAAERRFRRGFALLIPCFTVPMQVLQLIPARYNVATSLPLQLCDFAWVAAIVALWTRHWAATALVYFWGLTLTVQGILTPSLTDRFPDPQYFMFWGMHFFTVWAAVYLTFGLRVPVTWRSYRFAVACTSTWVVTMILLNASIGTNYGYLNHKPSVDTVLDLFGPWPGYVVVEVAVVSGVWAAVYLTFGLRVPVTWRSYRFAVACTSTWVVTMILLNASIGSNYGYLNHKPSVDTVLDLFGPWPGYVVVEVAVVSGVWALMTWPWVRASRSTAFGMPSAGPPPPPFDEGGPAGCRSDARTDC